ncbi:MAG: hypothetical protein AAF311_16410, partial [Pseudomonadota bacterium]
HAVSDTGYPYEIHHIRKTVDLCEDDGIDRVSVASDAHDALRADFAGWMAEAIAQFDEALAAFEAGHSKDAGLAAAVYAFKGNALSFDRPDLAEAVERFLLALEDKTFSAEHLRDLRSLTATA